jgi:hypothetical protein
VTIFTFSLPVSGTINLPAPLPAGLRGRVNLQAVLFPSLNPLAGETTPGLEVTFL